MIGPMTTNPARDDERDLYRQEVPLDELLADDAARLLMERDGVAAGSVRELLGEVARSLKGRDARR